MKNNKLWTRLLLGVLAAALIAVVAYILLKQLEYGAGNDYYGSLRGLL